VFWFNAGGRLSVDDVGRQIALMVGGAAIDSGPHQRGSGAAGSHTREAASSREGRETEILPCETLYREP
jgi:hypothetical protein